MGTNSSPEFISIEPTSAPKPDDTAEVDVSDLPLHHGVGSDIEKGPYRHSPEESPSEPEVAQQPLSPAFKVGIDEAETFERTGFSGFIQVPTERGLGFSALTIHVHGEHPPRRIVEGTRTYYVAEGAGTFALGEETHQVAEGDLFVLPEGSSYSYHGSMTLFEMNIPAELSATGKVIDEQVQ